MTVNIDVFTVALRQHGHPRPTGGGWPLSVPLQVAELDAMAARSHRAGRRAAVAASVLVPLGAGLVPFAPVVAAVVAVAAGERLVRVVRCWRAARRFEVEAMVRQLVAGPPAEDQPASTAAARRGWRTGAASRQ